MVTKAYTGTSDAAASAVLQQQGMVTKGMVTKAYTGAGVVTKGMVTKAYTGTGIVSGKSCTACKYNVAYTYLFCIRHVFWPQHPRQHSSFWDQNTFRIQVLLASRYVKKGREVRI